MASAVLPPPPLQPSLQPSSPAASSSSPRPSLITFSVSSSSPTSSDSRCFFAAIPSASPSLGSNRQRMQRQRLPLTPQRAVRAAESGPAAVNKKAATPTPRTPSTVKTARAEGAYERPEEEAGRLVAALAARGAEEARGRAGDRRDRGRLWEEEQALLQTAQRLSAHHIAVLLPHSEPVCEFLAVTAASLRSAQVLQSLKLLLRLLSSLPCASPPRIASAALLVALTAACMKETFLLEAALPCLRAALRLWPLRLLHHFAQPAQAASKNVQARQLSACILNTAVAALCRAPVLLVTDCAFCSCEPSAAAAATSSSSSSSLASLSAADLSQLLSQLQAAAEDGLAPTRRHSKQSVAAVFAAVPAVAISAAMKLLDFTEAEKLRRIAAASVASSSRPLPAAPSQQQQQHVTLPASLPSSAPSQPLLTPARVQAFATMPEAEVRKAMADNGADDVSWLGQGEEGLVSPITSPTSGLPEAAAASSSEGGETQADGGRLRLQAAEEDDDGDQVVRVHAARPLTPIPLNLSGSSQEEDDDHREDDATAARTVAALPLPTAPLAATQAAAAAIAAYESPVQQQQSLLVRPSLKRRRSLSPPPPLPPSASEPQLQPVQQEEPLGPGEPGTAAERLRRQAARMEEEMARGRRPTADDVLRLIELTNELREQQTARSLHRAKGREEALMQLMATAQTA